MIPAPMQTPYNQFQRARSIQIARFPYCEARKNCLSPVVFVVNGEVTFVSVIHGPLKFVAD